MSKNRTSLSQTAACNRAVDKAMLEVVEALIAYSSSGDVQTLTSQIKTQLQIAWFDGAIWGMQEGMKP